jgi:hypothetical protein
MTRSLIAVAAALLACVGLAAAGGAEAEAAPKPGFVSGTWLGTGIHKGMFDIGDGHPSPTTGTVRFTLVVDKSLKARGTLTIKTTMHTSIENLRGVVVGTGTMAISGTGSEVRYAGKLAMRGKLTDGKVTIPFRVTRPVSGHLTITRAGCTKVVGKTAQNFPIFWSAVPKPGTLQFKCA